MSKRPLIYEVIDSDGGLLFQSRDKNEALRECKKAVLNYLTTDITFLIAQNGKKMRVLAAFTGQELIELLEDELDD